MLDDDAAIGEIDVVGDLARKPHLVGDQTAPITSSAFINGQRSLASPTDIEAASTP
jgi:hypothetical protein